MKLRLNTTVKYKGNKYLIGSEIEVANEDAEEMKQYGEVLEGEQVLPFEDSDSDALEGDFRADNELEDEIPKKEVKKPVRRNTRASKK